jgi:hypothetical protein
MYLHTYIPPAGRHSNPQLGHTLHTYLAIHIDIYKNEFI